MTTRKPGYMSDVNDLISHVSPHRILAHHGLPKPEHDSGEHRLTCPFNEECENSSYGTLTINLSDPANRIYCHACGVRGNLLTLMWGLQHNCPPTGGQLRGEEFKEALILLREFAGQPQSPPENNTDVEPAQPVPVSPARNVPLAHQEKTKGLVNLYEDFITDPAEMPPDAAAYFRCRPWLTPEVCQQSKMGYLPRNGRSLLRGLVVYAHHDSAGRIISYSGRDPMFQRKWERWIANGRPEKKRPAKHRYVKGYHKGLELYGQQIQRLTDDVRESLATLGLFVVEGQNDVIRLAQLNATAVGLTMNRATDHQIQKLIRFARQVAGDRITLMPDNDAEGEAGFRDLMWELAKHGLNVQLAWSSETEGGRFQNKQPEDITDEEWSQIIRPRLVSHSLPLR